MEEARFLGTADTVQAQADRKLLQGWVANGAFDAQDALQIIEHNASHPERISPDSWTEAWFTKSFLGRIRPRESRQEEEALRNFARAQRARYTRQHGQS
jgi:hypothetical protein